MEKLTRFWWLNLLRGFIALALGISMLSSPKLFTILMLVWFVGAYMLIDGILSIVFSFTHPDKNRWWVFTGGILGIILAFMVFSWPGMTAVFMLYFIAFWAIFTGIMQIIFSIANWKTIGGKVWLLIGGIISLIFGGLLLANPGAGALAVLWLIAVYLILLGVALIMFSIWLCTKRKDFAKAAGA
jgi:uncharacterized membrane protein HdeD (DUF308 family)